jgi:hypothetical protein
MTGGAPVTLLAMEADIVLPTWLAWVVGGVLIVAIVCGFIIAVRHMR